jgi:hypothetical protein
LPAFAIVGLPDKAVSEARERVRSALIASGPALPARRITINLAPADLPKEGSHYDLPIALGLMAAIGAIPHDALSGFTATRERGPRVRDRAHRGQRQADVRRATDTMRKHPSYSAAHYNDLGFLADNLATDRYSLFHRSQGGSQIRRCACPATQQIDQRGDDALHPRVTAAGAPPVMAGQSSRGFGPQQLRCW